MHTVFVQVTRYCTTKLCVLTVYTNCVYMQISLIGTNLKSLGTATSTAAANTAATLLAFRLGSIRIYAEGKGGLAETVRRVPRVKRAIREKRVCLDPPDP